MEHQLVELEKCPVCSGGKHSFWRKAIDHNVSGASFSIVQCNGCGFRFTNPRPTENTIGNYYKTENYISHSSTKRGLINKLYHFVRKRAIQQKENLIRESVHGNKLLDFGCGTGDFLAYCKTKGWEVQGIEPDEDARSIASKTNEIEAFEPSYIKKIQDNSYDVITLWHVLEHVYLLNETIQEFKRILKPNGTLIVAVPNCGSYDADYYKEDWAALDLPIHLYHFRPKNIKSLFSNHGIVLEKVLPMKYDAYYISLISEKYSGDGKKNSSKLFNYPLGFWRGFISNQKAKSKKNTFSSQIYVLKNGN